MAVFFAACPQKCFAMYITMPAAAGENFFELASQYVPKMALLSSIIIEKSIQKDYAGGSQQNILLSNSLIYSKNACLCQYESQVLISSPTKKARSQLRFLARGVPHF